MWHKYYHCLVEKNIMLSTKKMSLWKKKKTVIDYFFPPFIDNVIHFYKTYFRIIREHDRYSADTGMRIENMYVIDANKHLLCDGSKI